MVSQETVLINWLFLRFEMQRGVFGQERVYLRAMAVALGGSMVFKGDRVTAMLRT